MGCGTSKQKSFRSLDVKGLTEMKISPNKALTFFTQSLQHKLERLDTYQESIGKSYLVIAYTYFDSLKDYIGAINPAMQALTYLESFSKKNLVLAYALLVISNLEKGHYDPAKQNLEKCLAVSKEAFAEGSEDSLIALSVKAYFDKKTEKFSDALANYISIFQVLEKMPLLSKDEVMMKKIQSRSLDEEKEPLDVGVTLLELCLRHDITEIAFSAAECYFNLKDFDNGCLYLQKYLHFIKEMHAEDSNFQVRMNRIKEKVEKLKTAFPAAKEKIEKEYDHFEKSINSPDISPMRK